MRWFLGRLLEVWIVVVAVVAMAVLLIGRQQPAPTDVSTLHFTDCSLPCWIGILPGKTTFEDAEQRIKTVYGAFPNYRVDFVGRKVSPTSGGANEISEYATVQQRDTMAYVLSATLVSRNDRQVIDSITFNFDYPYPNASDLDRMTWDKRPGMGDLQSVLGSPSFVKASAPLDRGWGVNFIYGSATHGVSVLLFARQGRIDWTSEVLSVTLFALNQGMSAQPLRLWRGFHPVDLYTGDCRTNVNGVC